MCTYIVCICVYITCTYSLYTYSMCIYDIYVLYIICTYITFINIYIECMCIDICSTCIYTRTIQTYKREHFHLLHHIEDSGSKGLGQCLCTCRRHGWTHLPPALYFYPEGESAWTIIKTGVGNHGHGNYSASRLKKKKSPPTLNK